jgi:hypothetical protein
MRLHATPKNHAPGAPDRKPSTCALDSSRSIPFNPPLSPRWSPVVLQRKMPSIPFPFLLLRGSFFPNDRGTPTPTVFSLSQGSTKTLSIPLTPVVSYSCALFLAPGEAEGCTYLDVYSLFSHSCALFCTTVFFNRFRFSRFRTLSQKPPGVGTRLPLMLWYAPTSMKLAA